MSKKIAAKERNIEGVLREYLTSRTNARLTEEQLFSTLSLPEKHLPTLRRCLERLVKEGFLKRKNNSYLVKGGQAKSNNEMTGVLRVHPRGFGFVQPDNTLKYPEDIFIPKGAMAGAVDGDRVIVNVESKSSNDKGPEGQIAEIAERGRRELAGTVLSIKNRVAKLYAPLMGEEERLEVALPPKPAVARGDRLLLEVIDWELMHCKLKRVIGNINDPSADIEAASAEYQIRTQFSPEALEEAASFGKSVPQAEIAQREDFRPLETVTIDPETAKDFDDAISLTKDEQGHYHLAVHIADVSHYVQQGSALDEEAQKRCNSTYFPGSCVPMLPEALSNQLCSLRPKVNRLSVSVLMEIDSQGELVSNRITRGVIQSNHRFTYKEAGLVLTGKRKSKHRPLLERMVELCHLLKRVRQKRGSIEFALPDLLLDVDEEGVPHGVHIEQYDITHQMIEEFMLKANEVVATHLSNEGRGAPYRIHEKPSEEDLAEFSQLASIFGHSLSSSPTTEELQTLFDEVAGTPAGQHLAVGYIRRMRMAYYSPNNIGHYGLSLEYYCHFTSPIRRYIDLVAHRLLFSTNFPSQALQDISRRCSDQERISAKAENSVKLLKKLRLLLKKEGPLTAVITQVKPQGITFDVQELMLDGFIHISQISDEYLHFSKGAKGPSLVGDWSREELTMGSTIQVVPDRIDLITRDVEWVTTS